MLPEWIQNGGARDQAIIHSADPRGPMPSRTCAVSFGNWTCVTLAPNLFEACRIACEWFNNPYSQDPNPSPDTVFTVHIVGQEDAVYRVRATPFLVPAPRTIEKAD